MNEKICPKCQNSEWGCFFDSSDYAYIWYCRKCQFMYDDEDEEIDEDGERTSKGFALTFLTVLGVGILCIICVYVVSGLLKMIGWS